MPIDTTIFSGNDVTSIAASHGSLAWADGQIWYVQDCMRMDIP